jgi:hypothetical protein
MSTFVNVGFCIKKFLSTEEYLSWAKCLVKLQINIELPLLKEFVDSALANGAPPYFHENERL